jgi:site-specific DNA recombinase
MTRSCTDEQAAIAEKIKTLRVELEKYDEKSDNSNVFLSVVCKYSQAKKLIIQMLGELIERIDIHQLEKVDGVHIQKPTIHYRCVGTL